MNKWNKRLALGIAAVLVLAVTWASTPYAAVVGPTVGQFATMLANLGNPQPPLTEEEALMKLSKAGVIVKDPNAALSEEMLAKIMRSFGFRTTSDNPRDLVDDSLAKAALALMSTSIRSGSNGNGNSGSPGRKSDVGVCLSEPNTGQCVVCCKGLGSPASICAQFCQLLASPSGP